MRNAAREVGNELARAVEQAARLARQAGDDIARLIGDAAPARSPKPRSGSPADLIRDIGRLRDEGLITEEEFQTKKADLLGRV
ncbi:MAG: SHOCT domain-containing protein [Thermoleophilia bacterium]|nr:SHOCT domain-containing protein [Thermoleophilia bacterium]